MEQDKNAYVNVTAKQNMEDREKYELLTIHTRDDPNEYEVPQIDHIRKNKPIVSDSEPDMTKCDAKRKKRKNFTTLAVLIGLLLITLAAIALSVSNYATTLSLTAKTQLAQSETGEQILAVHSQVNNSVEELKYDNNLMNIKLDNLSSLTCNCARTLGEIQEAHTRLQNEITSFKNEVYNYLSMNLSVSCGTGLWRRVAYLNMSDPSHQCPPVWREYSAHGVRACGRPTNATDFSCYSMNYSSSTQFNRVCGRVIGYQVGSTDAFEFQRYDINRAYVDGISITYGEPRTHIWTYASGISEIITSGLAPNCCPCLAVGTSFTPQTPPPFVGNNYYCESGNPISSFHNTNTFQYTNDPLWDGQNCEGRCCSDGRTPPWFSVQLTGTTTSDIEVRICGYSPSSNDDTPIGLLELHVQ